MINLITRTKEKYRMEMRSMFCGTVHSGYGLSPFKPQRAHSEHRQWKNEMSLNINVCWIMHVLQILYNALILLLVKISLNKSIFLIQLANLGEMFTVHVIENPHLFCIEIHECLKSEIKHVHFIILNNKFIM